MKHWTTRKRLLVVVSASLALWLIWHAGRANEHPYGDLGRGRFTDHFSHMNAARIFTRIGTDIWRRGVGTMFPRATQEQAARMPKDVRAAWPGEVYPIDGWPIEKPVVQSWSAVPRLYPPGDMVLVAPVALLYHFTSLSFAGANRLLIAWFLVFAHVALFFVLSVVVEQWDKTGPVSTFAALIVSGELIFWALQGFYDCATVTPLLLCAIFLWKRRPLAAILAYCIAAFIHFRAFFLAPLALWAAWMFIEDKRWKSWSWRDSTAAALALVTGLASLATFFMVYDAIDQQLDGKANPVHIGAHGLGDSNVIVFLVCFAIGIALLLRKKAWIDASILAWWGLSLVTLPGPYPWYDIVPMAWIVMPVLGACEEDPRGAVTVHVVRVATFGWSCAFVLRNHLWPTWLGSILG
jgi:hypothetical protein